ncbi:unnamed protein product [Arabidopsis lyrata]|uniref:Predicted protein n=1 Tax=Arabidopsis lyrata subsp. lyrata TaxID=81972 RepID=D7LV57_ARALL|nr:predicted protein [Arabidopsis lyrata subsp. lyrata]CAH8268721.1 unnamed protein product [Arabidopsis lyrata]
MRTLKGLKEERSLKRSSLLSLSRPQPSLWTIELLGVRAKLFERASLDACLFFLLSHYPWIAHFCGPVCKLL